jgi:hypothetical protein
LLLQVLIFCPAPLLLNFPLFFPSKDRFRLLLLLSWLTDGYWRMPIPAKPLKNGADRLLLFRCLKVCPVGESVRIN